MPNEYTVAPITSQAIPTSSTGLLDNAGSFPTTYKLVITPDPGVDILAKEFKVGLGSIPMSLSYNGDTNSHTEWPSKFQWQMTHLGQPSPAGFPTTSGLMEFPAFYKVVFQDSNNLTNDPNWILNPNTTGNQIYVWIYFGKNETTPISSLTNMNIDIDLDYHPDPLILSETILSGPVIPININSFNI